MSLGRILLFSSNLLFRLNIALGNAPVTACDAGDVNHDTQITVGEILPR
jgi:hypothetical protein